MSRRLVVAWTALLLAVGLAPSVAQAHPGTCKIASKVWETGNLEPHYVWHDAQWAPACDHIMPNLKIESWISAFQGNTRIDTGPTIECFNCTYNSNWSGSSHVVRAGDVYAFGYRLRGTAPANHVWYPIPMSAGYYVSCAFGYFFPTIDCNVWVYYAMGPPPDVGPYTNSTSADPGEAPTISIPYGEAV